MYIELDNTIDAAKLIEDKVLFTVVGVVIVLIILIYYEVIAAE